MLAAGPRDWCHQEFDFRMPDFLAELARAAGLRERRLTFASLVLRRDGRTLADAGTDARVVSAPLVSKGKRELVLCDARGLRKVRRLDRHASVANADFAEAGRGDRLAIAGDDARLGPETEVVRRP